MKTRTRKGAAVVPASRAGVLNESNEQRFRITLVVEGLNKDLDTALIHAIALGQQRYMGISYGSKQVDGPKVSCRTTRLRKARAESK